MHQRSTALASRAVSPHTPTQALLPAAVLVVCAWASAAAAQQPPAAAPAPGTVTNPLLTLDGLPRPAPPPLEATPAVPAQVQRWRSEAKAYEHGDGAPRDPLRAAALYCRAARYGDAEAQYALAWMLTNSRGIERDEAQAAHLFAAAAEQGIVQARNMAVRMGAPRGEPPACLRPPDEDQQLIAAAAAAAAAANPPPAPRGAEPAARVFNPPPPPARAPDAIVRFVNLIAPEYQLHPSLVLAIMATESNFDPNVVSPKNAQGLMQLIPETAARFGVRRIMDPAQNIRGGMAYLRWLLAYFQGDVVLAAAAYNAGEGAVERYRGVPPFAETRVYVWKIVRALGGQVEHPYDASVVKPSDAMSLMRTPWRLR
jgi:soluble lytic murein transglycosylase-like protein